MEMTNINSRFVGESNTAAAIEAVRAGDFDEFETIIERFSNEQLDSIVEHYGLDLPSERQKDQLLALKSKTFLLRLRETVESSVHMCAQADLETLIILPALFVSGAMAFILALGLFLLATMPMQLVASILTMLIALMIVTVIAWPISLLLVGGSKLTMHLLKE